MIRRTAERGGWQPRANLMIALVWVMLWDRFSFGNLLNGLILGAVLTRIFPLPPIEYAGRPHPVALLALLGRLLVDLVKSSLIVAAVVLRPGPAPPSSIIEVRLRTRSDLYLTLVSTLVGLVPGSTVIEARRAAGILYVHVLGVDDAAGREAARADVLAVERSLVRALGTEAEIAQCGEDRCLRCSSSPASCC